MPPIMRVDFPEQLTVGRLVRRYKRFFADVELRAAVGGHGEPTVVVAHCPNTGRMTGCAEPGCEVWLLPAPEGSKRKLRWTWVLSTTSAGDLCGVHTAYPNRLAEIAIREGVIGELAGYPSIRREVRMGQRSRVDIHCEGHAKAPPVWVEVKNVTLVRDGRALFPDAVTSRGLKHLNELEARVRAGDRAAMVFVVQRPDGRCVGPADTIDPEYGKALRRVAAAGVEVYAIRVTATPSHLEVAGTIPICLVG